MTTQIERAEDIKELKDAMMTMVKKFIEENDELFVRLARS